MYYLCAYMHTHTNLHTRTSSKYYTSISPCMSVWTCISHMRLCACAFYKEHASEKKSNWYGGANNGDVIKWRWYGVLRLYKCHQMPFSRKGLASASSFLKIDYTKSGHQWWNIESRLRLGFPVRVVSTNQRKNNASRFNWSFVGRLMLCIALWLALEPRIGLELPAFSRWTETKRV